ncbi:hypothetical protein GOZ88_24065 [Agrobacterium vitis]|uniref:Uncharacterized protein n=2 Tax=Agrobacterium vitis TaxID=373 RepID=A0A7K1RMB4_AGRVI|nr:hypothetical protein [Agrobacterium vitis]
MVVQGKANLYISFNQAYEWDTFDGQAILEGAGDIVCELACPVSRYGK